MIIKNFQVNNFDFKKNQFYLLYGENEGLKNEFLENNILKKIDVKLLKYDESEILINFENILLSLLNNSLFEREKLIIISRCTDKILKFVEELENRKIEDLIIVFKSSPLDKKSKLRSYFEKSKELICVPFYKDDAKTLSYVILNFFKGKGVSISQEMVNILVDRSSGERSNLKTELKKIESYMLEDKKVNLDEIIEITNLNENHSISELIDNCLKKNLKRTINILNENNFGSEDCILIIRTFLNKSKRLLQLRIKMENGINIEDIVNSHKPPIFWKDKESVKTQIKNWSVPEIYKLLEQVNEIELKIKKNIDNSIFLLSDFLISKSKTISN